MDASPLLSNLDMDPTSSPIDSPANGSERQIYLAAIKISTASDRDAFLARACQGREDLRSRLDRLIAAKEQGQPNLLQRAVAWSEGLLPDDTGLTSCLPTPPTRTDTAASTIDISHRPVVGRYKLIEVVAHGGMGTVYAAQQLEPVRRKVAVKVINPGMNSREILARFDAERQALAMMDHPNIASVLDGGTTDSGLPYFAMELVPGIPITDYCLEHDLSLGERLSLFVDLCRAVHHAHQRGIIHRDLKPSNILVAEDDHKPVVKVIDFGVAKALHGDLTDRTLLTLAWQLVGTPIYMSPEQAVWTEADIDTRSDVYSLGVVLYEMLTGTTPIQRSTLSRVGFEKFGRMLAQEDPPRPSERIRVSTAPSGTQSPANRKIPTSFTSKQLRRELDWIVMKAIARDREHRYPSASELADDVNRYVDGESVVACPPSLTYRLQKTVSQNRVAISILAVIMVALTAVAITSRWQISAVESARRETERREQRAIDLLHAFKLQGALTAFRDEKLVQLHERATELRSDPLLLAGHARPTDLINLLSEAARRPARASFSNPAPVHDIAATPDQTRFVSVDERGDVRLWAIDLADHGEVLLGSHGEPAHAVAVSPDGQMAVTGSTRGELRYWNLADRSLVRTLRPVKTGIETLRWSPDGQTIAAGARYSEVWVGDVNGNERFRIANDHRHESLLFSADSSDLIVPNRIDIGVYDVSTGQKRRSISTQPLNNVRTMCFAGKNDRWLVVGERYRENLIILDYDHGELLTQVPLGRVYPRAISASADRLWLRVSFSDGRVQVIQLSPRETGRGATGTIWSSFRAHQPASDSRLPLAFFAGNNLFLSGGADGRIHLWDQLNLRTVDLHERPDSIVASYLRGESGDTYHLHRSDRFPFLTRAQAFSEELVDGKLAVALDNKIVVIRAADRRVIAEFDSPLSDHREIAMAGGDRLIAGSANAICIWKTTDDWANQELVGRFQIDHHATPVLCDDGSTMIVDNDDANLLLAINVETRTTTELASIPGLHNLCLGPHERLLGAVCESGFRVMDRRTRETILRAENLGSTGLIRFTNDVQFSWIVAATDTSTCGTSRRDRNLAFCIAPTLPLEPCCAAN